jgi:site-specific recombinase XerD
MAMGKRRVETSTASMQLRSPHPQRSNAPGLLHPPGGGDIYRLSRILGHSTISTTQLYLRSMGIEHLREGHEGFSPLGNLGVQR